MTGAQLLDSGRFSIVAARDLYRGQHVILGDGVWRLAYVQQGAKTVVKVSKDGRRHTLTLDPREDVVLALPDFE